MSAFDILIKVHVFCYKLFVNITSDFGCVIQWYIITSIYVCIMLIVFIHHIIAVADPDGIHQNFLIMSPTFKKLEGHIIFGSFVHPFVMESCQQEVSVF